MLRWIKAKWTEKRRLREELAATNERVANLARELEQSDTQLTSARQEIEQLKIDADYQRGVAEGARSASTPPGSSRS